MKFKILGKKKNICRKKINKTMQYISSYKIENGNKLNNSEESRK